MKVLAGDIGGTNARLALVEDGKILLEHIYPSGEFRDFSALLQHFFAKTKLSVPGRACFGVAGVVKGSEAIGTNLPWKISAREIAQRFGFEKVCLINDFAAAALGILQLGSEWFEKIGPGKQEPGCNSAVLGPGTGLGEAVLVALDHKKYHVMATEGGHCDFAPNSPEEIELLTFLQGKYGHVSYERIISGPGLADIYAFCAQEQGMEPLEVLSPVDISKAALQGSNKAAEKALEIFCSVLGSEAGNLALKTLARGGVYIAGGIAPKIVSFLKKSPFRKSFEAKGRMENLLKSIPTYVVTNKDLGLLGAAAKALEL